MKHFSTLFTLISEGKKRSQTLQTPILFVNQSECYHFARMSNLSTIIWWRMGTLRHWSCSLVGRCSFVCRDTSEEEYTAELEESCPSSGSVTDSDTKLDVEDCPNTLLNVSSGVDLLELIFCPLLAIAGRESELFASSPTSWHPCGVYIVTHHIYGNTLLVAKQCYSTAS